MLKLENIKGGYLPDSPVLHGISMEVAKGEVVGIIGLNGCGKSTLGKAIMSMLPYRSGRIWLNGLDISNKSVHKISNSGIRLVLQNGQLFPQMTVKEHLQLACNEISDSGLKNNIQYLENEHEINIFTSDIPLSKKVNLLSGGERKLLALSMALIISPEYLIMDEISAGLSPSRLDFISILIKKLMKSKKLGIILIEQNFNLAVSLSDRLLLLERGIIEKDYIVDATFNINNLNENLFN